jgi:SET domain-containing protein
MKKENALLEGERCDSKWCEVRRSGIHGRGLFAKKHIPQGTNIIEYLGEKIDKEESNKRGWAQIDYAKKTGDAAVYIFTLDDEYDIDGDKPWNSARLINHSCKPNCEAWIEGDSIWIGSLRDIEKDEELFYNYGFDLESWEDHPCYCGAKRCVGYIAGKEYWPELKKRISAKKAKTKAKVKTTSASKKPSKRKSA